MANLARVVGDPGDIGLVGVPKDGNTTGTGTAVGPDTTAAPAASSKPAVGTTTVIEPASTSAAAVPSTTAQSSTSSTTSSSPIFSSAIASTTSAAATSDGGADTTSTPPIGDTTTADPSSSAMSSRKPGSSVSPAVLSSAAATTADATSSTALPSGSSLPDGSSSTDHSKPLIALGIVAFVIVGLLVGSYVFRKWLLPSRSDFKRRRLGGADKRSSVAGETRVEDDNDDMWGPDGGGGSAVNGSSSVGGGGPGSSGTLVGGGRTSPDRYNMREQINSDTLNQSAVSGGSSGPGSNYAESYGYPTMQQQPTLPNVSVPPQQNYGPVHPYQQPPVPLAHGGWPVAQQPVPQQPLYGGYAASNDGGAWR